MNSLFCLVIAAIAVLNCVSSVSFGRTSIGSFFDRHAARRQQQCRAYQQQNADLPTATVKAENVADFIGQFVLAASQGSIRRMDQLCNENWKLCEQMHFDDIISAFKNVHKSKGGEKYVLGKYEYQQGQSRDYHLFDAVDEESLPVYIDQARVQSVWDQLKSQKSSLDIAYFRQIASLCDDFMDRNAGQDGETERLFTNLLEKSLAQNGMKDAEIMDHLVQYLQRLSGVATDPEADTFTDANSEFQDADVDDQISAGGSRRNSVNLYKRGNPVLVPFKLLFSVFLKLAQVIGAVLVFIAAVFAFVIGLVFFELPTLIFCGLLAGVGCAGECCINGVCCLPEACCSTACCQAITCSVGSKLVTSIRKALSGCCLGCQSCGWSSILSVTTVWKNYVTNLLSLSVNLVIDTKPFKWAVA
ncbi:hypothetical protein MIR68_007576 [Amoeboaphelidium protococcarum]|nr:hypothetical protein MIR68_007576 [Amoeboaphelidium protococcarum]